MSKRDIFRLHDSAIAGIVRALQQGLLTGTDVSDHMRMMRLEPMRDDPDTLKLTSEYLHQEEETLDRLVAEADALQAETPSPLGSEDSLVVELPEAAYVSLGGQITTGEGDEHGNN